MYAGRAHDGGGQTVSRTPGKLRLAVSTCALGLGMTAVAQAAAPSIEVVERPAASFERSIEVAKLDARYRELLDQARRLDVEPPRTGDGDLRRAVKELDQRVTKAKRTPDFGLAPGVSQSTLEAIAACESGGDPTVVDASGTYYGKYQFDTSTWASVGGSGNPADASEAEQDYRASLLYARAGSSPWPVCG
jgi:Transglycosylase-like domain